MGRVLLFLAVLLYAGNAQAFGLSADRMYRSLVDAGDDEAFAGETVPGSDVRPDMTFKTAEPYSGRQDDVSSRMPSAAWRNIVVSVRNGRVTPFELAEIRRRSERENAEAIELLAWMYATGTGIGQDLPKSYAYYMHAAQLGVPSAYNNVRLVYQAMSPSQRETLPSY